MRVRWIAGAVMVGLFAWCVQPAALAGSPSGVDTVAAKSISKAGDRDNFGYGLGTGPAPCAFFDNREPEDLGVFDVEQNPGDETQTWTHTFAVKGTPKRIKLTTWEIFADSGDDATIDLDGITLLFEQGKSAPCDGYPEGGVKNVFKLTGSDAAIAADGEIVVTFNENGDDISLDRAVLCVKFA